MLLIFTFIFATAFPTGVRQHTILDSIRGRLVKTITTRGQFVSFDKNHADRFFLQASPTMRDASDQMVMNVVMTDTETDLFLANHAKEDLKVTYQVRDVTIPGGKTKWLNYAVSIRSLKTGDDAHGWPEKLASDTTLLQSCREKLRQLRGE
ncbi:MAG TPA: hypothetical protein VFD13_00790 [Candidatus Kapabacteria bacterium]|nr:hypothetical protein [Candidatus Kapabacteria bacterium]